MTTRENGPVRSVFISHAIADRSTALALGDFFRKNGIVVESADDIVAGKPILELIESGISRSSCMLVLLSPEALASPWLRWEVALSRIHEFETTGTLVIFGLLKDCDLPPGIEGRAVVDLRQMSATQLANLLAVVERFSQINFDQMTARSFEGLVAELLAASGFSEIRSTDASRDGGFDLVATSNVAHEGSAPARINWLVEMKLYRSQRADAALMRQLVGLAAAESKTNILLVTNGQLTSAARNVGQQSVELGSRLRVIEGPELTRMVLAHPDLVAKYFPTRQTPSTSDV